MIYLLLTFILIAIAIIIFIPSSFLFLECMMAILATNNDDSKAQLIPKNFRVSVLIPAHNEASVISQTLESIKPQLDSQDTLIVVADNCTDETAAIARDLDAMVIERKDEQKRGKGYALDYGLKFLNNHPPDIVLLIDADCIIQKNTISQISRLAWETNQPVQATYLISQPPKPTPKDLVSALAIIIKNLVRPLGLAQMGLPCLLNGTGMAFPWLLINQVDLASGNIVEDMQLGIDLAIMGHYPLFCSQALVTSQLPQQQESATSQRQRWEQGHLQTIIKQVPFLLKAAIKQKSWYLLALALELFIWPLSLLVMMWMGVLSLSLLLGVTFGSWIPTVILLVSGILIFLAIMASWAKFARQQIPALALLSIPLYLVWKVFLYASFLIKPQNQWVKTPRDSVESPK